MLKADFAKQLEIGLIQGKHPTVLARDLRKTWDVSQYQALRLMRTELARVQIDAQMQSYDNAGVTEYTYITCGFGDACPVCRALDGQHFKMADMLPGENAPPMHPNCHCSTSAYMDCSSVEWLKDNEIKSSGGVYGAYNDKNDPDYRKREKIGRDLYTEITNRKKSFEIRAVSKNSGLSIDEVSRIYDHMFVRKHLLSNGTKVSKFDPDYYMAHSWIRVREGKNIQAHDLTMLYHELEEGKIMGESLEVKYEMAHNKAQKKFNYAKELQEYLKTHDA
ncbi:minor capsid protein [Clostridium sp. SY8519]|uniref:minor capsid protein n=1 Tax=Clostridium sp. (strain SY8519) TaxID=1042156 RepID=UPI0013051D05|nr:minor capsid protein [Clostridium sp. SY8519]